MGHKSLRFAFYGLRDVSKTREKSVRDDILNKLYNDGLLENLSKKNLENIFNMNLEQLEKLYKTLKQYNTKELNKIQGALSDFINKTDNKIVENISLYDPIALDLNNNGKIDTLNLENGVFFDHNGDEIAFKSSWVNSSDGILARDIDGDGKITSGAELFGNFTRLKNGELAKNGAEALKRPR